MANGAFTQEQQIASAHWSRFGCEGFPIMKAKRGWIINIESTSLWKPFGTYQPNVFKTKTAAIDFFNNLCLLKFREWRA